MEKLSAIGMVVLVFSLISDTAMAQPQYFIDVENPSVTIRLDPAGIINPSLIAAGSWIP